MSIRGWILGLAGSGLVACGGGSSSATSTEFVSASAPPPASGTVTQGATHRRGGTATQPQPGVLDADPIPVDCKLGDPISGLSPSELDSFQRGRVLFDRRFTPSTGLGPFYNATSCGSCHSTPRPGGSAPLYRNFYLAMVGSPPGQSPLSQLASPVVPAFGSAISTLFGGFKLDGERVLIPDDVFGQPVTVAQRNTPPTFGVGLFEFVSNATILSNTDPDDSDGDGISGRHNTDSGSVGRLGYKAQANNIELFTRPPLFAQMGITSNPILGSSGFASLCSAAPQATFGPDTPTFDNDGVPDPEISDQDLTDLITFTRFLAPPRARAFDTPARQGQLLFDELSCTKCHIPTLPSSRGRVNAYTDLLLHEMGATLADGIQFGVPQPSTIDPDHTAMEFRTQPLWGVSMHAPFLHDGRAETLDEAIRLHGGEAQGIRDAYVALSDEERAKIIRFLEHL